MSDRSVRSNRAIMPHGPVSNSGAPWDARRPGAGRNRSRAPCGRAQSGWRARALVSAEQTLSPPVALTAVTTFVVGGVHDSSRTPLPAPSPPSLAPPQPASASAKVSPGYAKRARPSSGAKNSGAATDSEGELGAEGGTRTPTGCPTRPSNVRVCQFRHFGPTKAEYAVVPSGLSISGRAGARARVERVANSLAEEVVGEHRDQDRDARIGREPPADLDRVLALVEDVAPGRVWRLDAEPEKRETGLREDRRRDAERHRHQHRPDRVGQDVSPDRAE